MFKLKKQANPYKTLFLLTLFLMTCVATLQLMGTYIKTQAADFAAVPNNCVEEKLALINQRQKTAQQMANAARELGYSDDHIIIREAKKVWHESESQKPEYTQEELDVLATVVYYEAGSNEISDRHQQLVAQVVLNRVNSEKFKGDTIPEIIAAPGQYTTLYLRGVPEDIPERCYTNAIAALEGRVDCPDNVLYQSNYRNLGAGIYEIHYTSYSTSYFSYG